MRAAVNRLLPRGLAVLLLAAAADAAEPAAEPGADRWVPGFGLLGGVTVQTHEARVASFDSMGDELRPFDRGRTYAVTPNVGAEIQLTSPAIDWIPGGPRLFVRGEFLPHFSPSRDVAKEADPTGVTFPKPEPKFFPESATGGVGSRTTTEFGLYAWGAGIGISFPFEFLGRQIRVSSTASWIRYEVELEGLVVAARKDDDNPVPKPNPPPAFLFGANLREINLFAQDTKTLHGIGPGLEVEMDAARQGPFAVSIFLGGHLYRVLGNRSARFSKSASFDGSDGVPADTYTANWSFDPGRWLYRAALGVRFRFVGN